jgi:hypothetical protein
MGLKLSTVAVEESVYGIRVSFFDSAGLAATPKTLAWSLTDSGGAVVNDRKAVVISTPASTVTIVLKGDDLQMLGSAQNKEARLVIVEGTYDDAVLGMDCPIREEVSFLLENRQEAV